MCKVSFALGKWRASRGKPAGVRLAPAICQRSYLNGYEAGRRKRS